MRRLLAVSLLLGLTSVAFAQQPQVRVEVIPKTVPVGEPAELRVTVLVPTWFTTPPVFPSFELANAITRLPPDSSYPTSARVGSETWSGIVRNYKVYPLAGATYRIEGQTLKVVYANPGNDPVTANVTVPTIELHSQVPDGARGLDHYIAGRQLTLTREVEGDVAALAAGDAIVMRYTAELDGLPAMFLPPLFEDPRIPGVSVYMDEPVVTDDGVARRSEKVTLVFDAGGDFVIPNVSLDWWDSRNEVIKTASVDAVTLSVDGPPVPAPAATEGEPVDRTDLMRLAALVVVALVVIALFLPRILRRLRTARLRRRESEKQAYKRLRSAFRSGDLRTVHHELILWLEKLEPGLDLRQFAERYGDDALEKQLDLLSRSLFQGGTESASLQQLESGVGRARRMLKRRMAQSRRFALPPLNP